MTHAYERAAYDLDAARPLDGPTPEAKAALRAHQAAKDALLRDVLEAYRLTLRPQVALIRAEWGRRGKWGPEGIYAHPANSFQLNDLARQLDELAVLL